MATIHEIYIFPQTRSQLSVTHRHNFEIQNALVSIRRTLLNWKVVNREQTYLLCLMRIKPLVAIKL